MTNRYVRVGYALGCTVLVMVGVQRELVALEPAATPRPALTSDGKPDLSGIWVTGNAGNRAPSTDSKGSIQVYLSLPGLNPDSPNVFKEMDSVAVKLRAAS